MPHSDAACFWLEMPHGAAPSIGFGGASMRPQRTGDGYHRAMSKLLMNLRNVPDDEADDVRQMLDARQIAFYETRPSMWGVSAGGIWVTEDAAFADARAAMDEYQQQRATRARADYAQAKQAGTAETFVSLLRADPARVVLSVLGILLALGLVTIPFFLLRR